MEGEIGNVHFVEERFNEMVNECLRVHVYTANLERRSHLASQDILMVNLNFQIRICRRDVLREWDNIMFRRDTSLLVGGCC
jgi:hypothetical protein